MRDALAYGIPRELRALPQWVGWKYGKLRTSGKREKVPINPRTGGRASVDKATTWGAFEEVTAAVERFGLEGVGFVFTENDPYCGVDKDDCTDPGTGEVHPYAQQIVDRLGGYAEISPSGTGVKSIVKARKPGSRCKAVGPWGGDIEMYDSNRFFALTGRVYNSVEVIPDAQRAVEALYRRIWHEGKPAAQEAVSGPPGGNSCPDAVMIDKARANPKFRQLHDAGDTSGYASASEAELAYFGYAAFWTGKDRERMDEWYRRSGLYREKWERENYREPTLDKAIAGCANVYDPKGRPRTNGEARQMLAGWITLLDGLPWNNRGGPIDRATFEYVINTGVGHGHSRPNGVLVAVSNRDVANYANCGDGSARRALRDLEEKYGYMELVTKGKKGRASEYLIKLPPEGLRKAAHITPPNPVFNMSRFACLIREVRNTAPFERRVSRKVGGRTVSYTIQTNRAPIRCITKPDAVQLERVVQHGRITRRKLHALGGGKKGRECDTTRRMVRLVEYGLVRTEWSEAEQDIEYVAPKDVVERLEDHIKASGCREAAEHQRQRRKEERQKHRQHHYPHQPAPEEVPVEDEHEHEHEHDLGCECMGCSIPAPRYAIPYGMRAA